jgi:hypothetical protein
MVFLLFNAFFIAPPLAVQADTISDIGFPFGPCETWYIWQGYKSGTHEDSYNKYAFDLVKGARRDDSNTGGATIISPVNGTVTSINVNQNPQGGMDVLIKIGDGSTVVLAHLMNIKVSKNQQVNRGTIIGEVSDSRPGGVNHLHFAVLKGGGIPLDFGVWNYPEENAPSPDNNGLWSGTTIQSSCSDIKMDINAPATNTTLQGITAIRGWAIDRAASSGTGVNKVQIYLDGSSNNGGKLIATATYGIERNDVARIYGARYRNSGYQYVWNTGTVANGKHTLYVYVYSTVSGWSFSTREINVQNPNVRMDINAPAAGATIQGTTTIRGWAIHQAATWGTGIDKVHIYLDGPAGGDGTIIAWATYGIERDDVARVYGERYRNSGYQYVWDTSTVPNGQHTLSIYVHSTISGWSQHKRTINVQNPVGYIDYLEPDSTVSGTYPLRGWAKVDQSSIRSIEVWIDGVKRGTATYGIARPDAGGDYGYSWEWDTTAYSNGAHTIQVKAIAAHGGSTWLPSAMSRKTTLPVTVHNDHGCGFSVNNGATYTGQRAVHLWLNTPGAAEIQLSNDGGFRGASWQPYQKTMDWMLNDPGQRIATLVVYARFRDADGELMCGGATMSDDLVYDPLPPVVAVRVRDAAISAAGSATPSEPITLQIDATDQEEGSGVATMQTSLQRDFGDTIWEPYRETVQPAAQPGDTVYVRVRDAAGNPSEVVRTTIPTTHGIAATAATPALEGNPNTTVVYSLHILNSGNTTDVVDVAVSENTWTTTAPATIGPVAAGERAPLVVEVTIPTDAANNATDTATITLTSHGDRTKTTSIMLTTSARVPIAKHTIHLPLVIR